MRLTDVTRLSGPAGGTVAGKTVNDVHTGPAVSTRVGGARVLRCNTHPSDVSNQLRSFMLNDASQKQLMKQRGDAIRGLISFGNDMTMTLL